MQKELSPELKEERQKLIDDENVDEEAVDAYIELGISDDLSNFSESYAGKFPNDEEFVQDLLEQTGDIPKDLPAYIHIDWEWTAREVMMDYSEQDGYYFRNL